MSYTAFPSRASAGAPGATDDNTKGFVVGSQWVDTSAVPRQVYLCTNAATGGATWVSAGGVSSHPSLSTLGWSASGHTGTASSVACFNAVGAAQTVQAVEEGSTLTFKDGVLQFIVTAAAIAVISQSEKTVDVEFTPANTAYTILVDDAAVAPGSFV